MSNDDATITNMFDNPDIPLNDDAEITFDDDAPFDPSFDIDYYDPEALNAAFEGIEAQGHFDNTLVSGELETTAPEQQQQQQQQQRQQQRQQQQTDQTEPGTSDQHAGGGGNDSAQNLSQGIFETSANPIPSAPPAAPPATDGTTSRAPVVSADPLAGPQQPAQGTSENRFVRFDPWFVRFDSRAPGFYTRELKVYISGFFQGDIHGFFSSDQEPFAGYVSGEFLGNGTKFTFANLSGKFDGRIGDPHRRFVGRVHGNFTGRFHVDFIVNPGQVPGLVCTSDNERQEAQLGDTVTTEANAAADTAAYLNSEEQQYTRAPPGYYQPAMHPSYGSGNQNTNFFHGFHTSSLTDQKPGTIANEVTGDKFRHPESSMVANRADLSKLKEQNISMDRSPVVPSSEPRQLATPPRTVSVSDSAEMGRATPTSKGIGYVALPETPKTWGPNGRYKYQRSGELHHSIRLGVAEMYTFLTENPRRVTLWIGRTPSKCRDRLDTSNGDSSKCRFSDCPVVNGTMEKGMYRVIIDEQRRKNPDHDPFHNAGYVHLWCLERFLDFPGLILNKRLSVVIDDGKSGNERDQDYQKVRFATNKEVRCGQMFIRQVKRDQGPPPNYPHYKIRGTLRSDQLDEREVQEHGPYKGTLSDRIVEYKLQIESRFRKPQAAKADENCRSRLIDHRNDLAVFAPAREYSRKVEGQLGRRERHHRRAHDMAFGDAVPEPDGRPAKRRRTDQDEDEDEDKAEDEDEDSESDGEYMPTGRAIVPPRRAHRSRPRPQLRPQPQPQPPPPLGYVNASSTVQHPDAADDDSVIFLSSNINNNNNIPISGEPGM